MTKLTVACEFPKYTSHDTMLIRVGVKKVCWLRVDGQEVAVKVLPYGVCYLETDALDRLDRRNYRYDFVREYRRQPKQEEIDLLKQEWGQYQQSESSWKIDLHAGVCVRSDLEDLDLLMESVEQVIEHLRAYDKGLFATATTIEIIE